MFAIDLLTESESERLESKWPRSPDNNTHPFIVSHKSEDEHEHEGSSGDPAKTISEMNCITTIEIVP